jgi:hypothetical protein
MHWPRPPDSPIWRAEPLPRRGKPFRFSLAGAVNPALTMGCGRLGRESNTAELPKARRAGVVCQRPATVEYA